jgi:hypothetical protein
MCAAYPTTQAKFISLWPPKHTVCQRGYGVKSFGHTFHTHTTPTPTPLHCLPGTAPKLLRPLLRPRRWR